MGETAKNWCKQAMRIRGFHLMEALGPAMLARMLRRAAPSSASVANALLTAGISESSS